MSAGEVGWRVRGKIRNTLGRALLAIRSPLRPVLSIIDVGTDHAVVDGGVIGEHIRHAPGEMPESYSDAWRRNLLGYADRIAEHRLDLFNRDHLYLGKPIQWNYEHNVGRPTPLTASTGIDYRDLRAVGDCKWVWEPNRHHQFVVLARAYRVSAQERYAEALLEQFGSWCDQCPYGRGMNWRSPLELGVRLINWVWAFALIDDASVVQASHRRRLWQFVDRHLWEISRNYSRHSSANNHLVGEAAGVFVASGYFKGFGAALRLMSQSRSILEREIQRQTYPDGGTREQATGYHLFTLELFLLAGLAARNGGQPFSDSYWVRLEKMFEFVAGLLEGSRTLPAFGDGDDAYVLDLGSKRDPRALLSVGAELFDRDDFRIMSDQSMETAFWLLGAQERNRFHRSRQSGAERTLASRAFHDSGYFVLQRGPRSGRGALSAVFDCGDLGFLSLAAHGHADALSFVLRIDGEDFLVDPGTYDYFSYPTWRSYFRSTRAHNTIVVDGVDQSEMLGPFLWGRRARCELVCWNPQDGGGSVCGEHDGYGGLPDPVVHRRTVTLEPDEETLTVCDELLANKRHRIEQYWHFAPSCTLDTQQDNTIDISSGERRVRMELDASLHVSVQRGVDHPIGGWFSSGYHRKMPSNSVRATCEMVGSTSFTTKFVFDAGSNLSASRQQASTSTQESRPA